MLGTAIGSIMMMGAGGADMGISAAISQGATVGFTTGFISSGGDMHQAVKGAVLTGASAGFTKGLADHFGHDSWSAQDGLNIKGIAAQGTNQGTITAMGGGKFGSGFISGIIGKTSGVVMKTFDFEVGSAEARYGGASIAALFGGLASEATGGKFQDGAMSAVVVYLFNDLGIRESFSKLGKKIGDGTIGGDIVKGVKGGYGGYKQVRDNAPAEGRYLLAVAKTQFEILATGGTIVLTELQQSYNFFSGFFFGTIPTSAAGVAGVVWHDITDIPGNNK